MALAEIFADSGSFSDTKEHILIAAIDKIRRNGTFPFGKSTNGRNVSLDRLLHARSVKTQLTLSPQPQSQTSSDWDANMISDQQAQCPEIALIGPAWQVAAADLSFARSLVDGWKGPGSLGPSESAIDDATSILSAMAMALAGVVDRVAPALGVDGTGEVVLSWSGREGIFGSLSINGDGTFSFYVERHQQIAEGGDLPITGSLPGALVDVLLGVKAA